VYIQTTVYKYVDIHNWVQIISPCSQGLTRCRVTRQRCSVVPAQQWRLWFSQRARDSYVPAQWLSALLWNDCQTTRSLSMCAQQPGWLFVTGSGWGKASSDQVIEDMIPRRSARGSSANKTVKPTSVHWWTAHWQWCGMQRSGPSLKPKKTLTASSYNFNPQEAMGTTNSQYPLCWQEAAIRMMPDGMPKPH